jgi:hydrophobe/amphiphile efflux-3 (HAE3) family protein
VLVGCVSAFGLMGFLGIPLTMVTISGLPILMGLGVDFAVQVHSRVEEETYGAEAAEAGVDRAAALLGPALVTAALAAVIGFLVLHISNVPMIRDFGSMLAVGAVIVFITSITLIASVVFLRERKRIGPRSQVRARIEVERIVGGLTSRTVGRLLPIAAAACCVALIGLYVGQRITTQTDPERFVSSGSSVLKDLFYVRKVTGSTSEVSLLVEVHNDGTGSGGGPASVIDDSVLSWMMQYEDGLLHDHSDLQRSNSIASLTRQLTGADPTHDSAQQTIDIAPPALVRSVVSDDLRSASITFAISGGESLDDQRRLTNAVEQAAHPPAGVTVAPAGIAVVGAASVDALTANRDLMSFVALSAIFALLLAIYRNPVKAIAPLLPVVLALGASAMILYASGVEYSPLTSISGPLIIAMGTEFSVLLMSRYFEERALGRGARAAMSTASLGIGRAIMASGLTVMGGFAVLAFSGFPLLDNFGKVTALNIGLSLISTLVLLPPLLVWADEDRGFVSVAPRPATE